MINSHFNNLTYRTKNRWCFVDAHFQNGAVRVILSLLGWNMANTSFMIVCIQSASRLLMMQDQKSLMRRWLSCSGWGKERVSLVFSYNRGRFIWKGQWCAKVNILRLTVGYLNATIKDIPETQNRRLEPTGFAKPGKTRRLTGTGPGLAGQDTAGRVFGRFWKRTEPSFWSVPGPLAGNPDPLLTLFTSHWIFLSRSKIQPREHVIIFHAPAAILLHWAPISCNSPHMTTCCRDPNRLQLTDAAVVSLPWFCRITSRILCTSLDVSSIVCTHSPAHGASSICEG